MNTTKLLIIVALGFGLWMLLSEEKQLDKAEQDAKKAMDQLQRNAQGAMAENQGMQDKK